MTDVKIIKSKEDKNAYRVLLDGRPIGIVFLFGVGDRWISCVTPEKKLPNNFGGCRWLTKGAAINSLVDFTRGLSHEPV